MAIKIQFEIGHSSKLKSKKTSEGFTHDWELFVQGIQKADISHFVEKVVFNLHGSFRKPKRTFKEPPYILKESGYAGFTLPIDIYFKNRERVQFVYDLDLQQTGPPAHRSEIKKYIFDNPAEDFRQKLLKGGGVPVTASGTVGAAGEDSGDRSQQLLSKPKLSIDPVPNKKPKIRPDEKANTFATLFGPPITKNAPKISPDVKKDSGSAKSGSSSASNKDKVPGTSVSTKDGGSSKPKEKGEKSEKKEKDKSSKHASRSPHKDKQRDRDEKKEKKHDKREKHHSKETERNREDKVSKRVASPKRFSPVRSSSVASRDEASKDGAEKKTSNSSHSSKKSKKDKKSHDKDKDRERKDKDKSESKKREDISKMVKPATIKEVPEAPKAPTPLERTPTPNSEKKSNEKEKEKDDKRHKHKKKDKEKKSKDKLSKLEPAKKTTDLEAPRQVTVESTESVDNRHGEQLVENASHNSDSSNISLLDQTRPSSQSQEAPPAISPFADPSVHLPKPEKKEDRKSRSGEPKKRRRESTAVNVFVEPPSKASKNEKSPHLPTASNRIPVDEDRQTPLNREYLTELQELHQKIMTLQDNNELQQVVELIVAIGKYEITSKTFDFDLCKLDRSTVQRLQDILATSVS